MLRAYSVAGSTPTVCARVLGALALVFASVTTPMESAHADSATPAAIVVAQAGGVPSLEFAQGCHAGARGDAKFLATCMHDEQQARQQLVTSWETFPHADRTQCTALARLGGGGLQSYVELITCLEMAKQARALPKSAKE
jgi:hypothetical protein